MSDRCSTCAAPLHPGDRFCEQCGSRSPQGADAPPASRTSVCHVCGASLDDVPADGYCTSCGARPRARPQRAEDDAGTAAGVTEQGRTHRRNEDAFFLHAADGGAAGVVCDGISSATAGDVAAQRAAQAAGAVLARALDEPAIPAQEAILDAFRAAQDASAGVVATSRLDRDAPSCTLVSAVARPGEVVIGWVGDSRAYWVGAGATRRLTTDDSWAEEQVAIGAMSAQEAQADARAHAITRWVGGDAPGGPPNLEALAVEAPARLVLCTDGLWNYLDSAAELDDVVAALPPGAAPAAIARALTDLAMSRGGRDDVTVVVLDLQPVTEPRGEPA